MHKKWEILEFVYPVAVLGSYLPRLRYPRTENRLFVAVLWLRYSGVDTQKRAILEFRLVASGLGAYVPRLRHPKTSLEFRFNLIRIFFEARTPEALNPFGKRML